MSVERETREDGLSRRVFLRYSGLGCTALAVSAPTLAEPWRSPSVKGVRSVILLWMDGGPSPYETFAPPAPGAANPGPFGAIPSSVPGLQVSELMPRMAGWMDRVTLYRALQHTEGSHAAAAHLALTGHLPDPDNIHLTLGETVTRRLGTSHGVTLASAPHNDHEYCPHLPGPQASSWPQSTPSGALTNRRHALLTHLDLSAVHRHTYTPTHRHTDTTDFTRLCRAAVSHAEAGVPFIQVTLSGWDAHSDLAETYGRLVPQLDQGCATLLGDLEDRGMLDETLVVWMGEFGRSPRINALGGRDHWPYAGCALLAGGGIPAGQVVGEVDSAGHPASGAVTPAELLGQIHARLSG